MLVPLIIVFVVTAAIVSLIFWIIDKKKIANGTSKVKLAEQEAKRIEDEARKQANETLKLAEAEKKEKVILAKEEIQKERAEVDKEIKERRAEVQKQERRILQKEETLDRKIENLEKKEVQLAEKAKSLEAEQEELNHFKEKQIAELEKIAGMSKEDAKNHLLNTLQETLAHESAVMIKEYESKTKDEAQKKAKEIITYAVQKCAADHTSETTVSVVPLPSDDMKGRIIGREGRNIKMLETLTGIDLIIDDTPEAVILSGFDPIRREVARIALENLVTDGRIHPARIEEMVEKAKEELESIIKEEGESASLETGVIGLHPDVIKLIGKLKYRTSYGQNVLNHSIEVSQLAGIMAEELGFDSKLAKRAGLLHDIGKAIDHEMEGTHVQIGVDILKKYKENSLVINAVEAHHGDVEPQTMEAVLVQAADAISASRPGARRETLEAYIKRLEKLEEIADSFDGVEKSFAIQAGREVRIIVKPENISDDQMVVMARDVAKRIEDEMNYPGQIKVNVVRETRAIEYAK
ncbi:MAG: ribonuclease Y [Clostridia bacterium]|nr:ribonuclease Y [Clostridia bacterium]